MQRAADVVTDIGDVHARFNGNLVGDANHSVQTAHILLRGFALIIPVNVPCQGDPAGFHPDFHPIARDGNISCQTINNCSSYITVIPLTFEGNLNLKFFSHRQYALDAARGSLGGMLLRVAFDLPGEGHNPAIRGDPNMRRRDAGFPFEFGQYGIANECR
jgi:hypothetical protein